MLQIRNLTKTYKVGSGRIVALDNVNIDFPEKGLVFIVGKSGSGKSTFLKLVLKEEVPTSGSVFVDGKNLSGIKAKDIPFLRRKVGSVFQDFRLLYDKTVYENIVQKAHKRVIALLDGKITLDTKEVK